MCTDKNQGDFIVLHHEMGHIEYQMLYSHDDDGVRPTIFRDGANPGKINILIGMVYIK